jgi:eukaryotic translation initiation factor 2C
VLLDEIFRNKIGERAADELQRLTHDLCYLFGRATKAVSICPPAYYADIVCERARVVRPEFGEASDAASAATGAGGGAGSSSSGRETRVHPNLQNTMYYV